MQFYGVAGSMLTFHNGPWRYGGMMQEHSPVTLPVLPVNIGCYNRGWLIGLVCRGNDLMQYMHGQFFLPRS